MHTWMAGLHVNSSDTHMLRYRPTGAGGAGGGGGNCGLSCAAVELSLPTCLFAPASLGPASLPPAASACTSSRLWRRGSCTGAVCAQYEQVMVESQLGYSAENSPRGAWSRTWMAVTTVSSGSVSRTLHQPASVPTASVAATPSLPPVRASALDRRRAKA